MDTIDKWLKSLRLHKYTHLFKSLTYQQMLNLDEKYLIEHDVTKGARNKMLVSVKKLNLRHDRLINMIDDLNQDNISMKEALTVLRDMLMTPIPPPVTSLPLSQSKLQPSNVNHNHIEPYELTHLFIGTLDKVARRLIESAGMEDNACHGIMSAIVDECLKHNSFTKEQKAKVASFKQHFSKEQKAKTSNFKQQSRQRPHNYNYHHYQQQNHYQHNYNNQQPLFNQLPLQQFPFQQQHQQSQQQMQLQDSYQQELPYQMQLKNHSMQQQAQYQNHQSGHNYHYLKNHNHWNGPIEPPSLSTSPSRMSSACLSDEEEQQQHQPMYQQNLKPKLEQQQQQQLQQQQYQDQQQEHHDQQQQQQRQTYKEYSLLGPGMTFELPCLRVRALAEKHNRHEMCFLQSYN